MPLQSGLSGLTTGRCVKGLYNLVADVRASLYSKTIGCSLAICSGRTYGCKETRSPIATRIATALPSLAPPYTLEPTAYSQICKHNV